MKIANKWYAHKTLGDGLTLIYEPHVHPALQCNIWHIRGRDKDLLIDTGLGVASLREGIAELLDKPVIALATHIHFDHVGCLHEFEERCLHESEAPRMKDYQEFSFLENNGMFDDYVTHGDTAGFDDLLINALPSAEFQVSEYRIRSAEVTRSLAEGDVVDLGDKAFEVFHLPGHSPGSIGLWDKLSATLFSGDALYDGTLLDELPDSSIPDYIATMKRLRDLPVEQVHGGHEPSFGRERMLELIDAYLHWREA